MGNAPIVNARIAWKVDLAKPWKASFYPSLVTKIQKSSEYFEHTFFVEVYPLDEMSFNLFTPVYKEEIASRKTYNLDVDEVTQKIKDRVLRSKKYFLFALFVRETKEYAGGIIFSDKKDHVSYMYRAYRRDISKKTKQKTTVDFWCEAKAFQLFSSQNKLYIIRGKDHHPYIKRVGLPIFKLEVGGFPVVSKDITPSFEIDISKLTYDDLPLLYFSNVINGIYAKATFLYSTDTPNDVLQSFVKICEWKDLDYEVKSIS